LITKNNIVWICISLLALVFSACGAAESTESGGATQFTTEVTHAHEDGAEHTHVVGTEEAFLTATAWTDELELFMEYPPLRAGVPASFAVHLTGLPESKPVVEGPVIFHFMRGQESVKLLTMGNPEQPGILAPDVVFDDPGELRLVVEVLGDSISGEIEVDSLTVHETEADLSGLQPEADGATISYLKQQQWVLPFATSEVEIRSLRQSFQSVGEILAKSSHDTVVFPLISGQFIEPPGGIPFLGTRVEKGQLLGTILRSPDQQSTLSSNQVQTGLSLVEMNRLVADSEASLAAERSRLELARRQLERVKGLFEMEAVSERRLEESRSEVDILEAGVRAEEAVRQSLKEVEQRIQGQGQDLQTIGKEIPLEAPISGTIIEMNVVAGAFVEAQQNLYRIVDLSEVWVQGVVYEADIGMITPRSVAIVRLHGRQSFTGQHDHEASFELQSNSLVMVGNVVDEHTRTIPVIWEVSNMGRQLKIGMLASLDISTGDEVESLAIPASAVFLEENKNIVYVQGGGETFVRRIVTTGIKDREWVQILDGLEEGERVVVTGGYEVALASRSTDSLADHGHAH
jgi:RND family efflux transporter MFP subunit